MTLSTHQAAQEFIAAAYSILPIRTDGTKRPAGEWGIYRKRHATPEELRQWYASNQSLGIGVVCGSISGNLEVVDVDQVELSPAFEQIIETSCPGLLSKIITIKTPRDGGQGRQYWYRLPYECPIPALHQESLQEGHASTTGFVHF